MTTEANKYIKYPDLVREDIREEFDLLGIKPKSARICDFGCGKGITAFGLAIESPDSECIGVDLFGEELQNTPAIIDEVVINIKGNCADPKAQFWDVCSLIKGGRQEWVSN